MGHWGAGGLSDPPPGVSSCCLTQSSRSLVDGHGGPCWPCQCCQSKAKKWPKAGAAGGARRESKAALCVRALNREAWPGAWPWGRAPSAVCRGRGSGGLKAGRHLGLGQVLPYVGGQLEPTYPCLRTWRITGRCPPPQPVALSCVLIWGKGSALPSFWGIPRAARLEAAVSGGKRSLVVLQGHGGGLGEAPVLGTRVLRPPWPGCPQGGPAQHWT